MSYSPSFLIIVDEFNQLMRDFVYTQKDIGYGYRWTFPNKHRVDMIDYQKTATTIMRVGRGTWLVKTYPLLYGWFDEVLEVIAKVELSHSSVLELKNVIKKIHGKYNK